MTSKIVVAEEYTFTIEMVNPCRTTILDPVVVSDVA